MKKHIPNLVTSLNLLTGCVAIALAFYNVELAAYFIFLAVFLDFLDGFLARLLKVQSEFGKQLDSLADIVSFGIAPAVILYIVFLKSWNLPGFVIDYIYIIPFVSFLIPVFSALRLARFNLDKRQADIFYGLPTPANAMLIISIPLVISQYGPASAIGSFALDTYFLFALILLSSFLLVCRIPFFSLKFKGFGWKGNELRFIFIIISLGLIIIFRFAAIPIIIVLYILLSIIFTRQKT